MDIISNLEAMLSAGKDSAMLRFGLGDAYLKAGKFDDAVTHLRLAVQSDPNYSAAWKLLGKALTESGNTAEAQRVYEQGIAVAEAKGDMQAAKEMTVFLKRLRKNTP